MEFDDDKYDVNVTDAVDIKVDVWHVVVVRTLQGGPNVRNWCCWE